MNADLTTQQVLWALAMRRGADNGISARDLVSEICGGTSPALERQLRSLIEQLRRDGEHICGEPAHGYFLAANEEDLLRTVRFLHDRAMTSLTQAAAMQKVAIPNLRGQLRLPE